ncbi:MAG: hypothetical protein KKB30_17185 [Proteobacteria bacterium]|nr:hypothetical protein [Pseudomonadota bacterium]
MKYRSSIVLIALCLCCSLAGAEDLPFTNLLADLNHAWAVTNYDAMEQTFQKALAHDTLHPYALAAILNFYVFGKQDYDKANQYADEFLSLIRSRGTDEEIAWATETVHEIKRIPRSEYAPFTERQRAQLRGNFKEFFVNPIALKVVRRIESRGVQPTGGAYVLPEAGRTPAHP